MIGALAYTAVVVAFMLGAGRGAGSRIQFALIVGIALANASLLTPNSLRNRILETFGAGDPAEVSGESVDSSTAERLAYWRAAVVFCREDPVGYGAYMFPELIKWGRGVAKVAHNIYLTTLVDYGAQGFIAILTLVQTISARLVRSSYRESDAGQSQLSLALVGWWAGHVAAHIFLGSFFTMLLVGQSWMMYARQEAGAVGVAVAPEAVPPKVPVRSTPRPRVGLTPARSR